MIECFYLKPNWWEGIRLFSSSTGFIHFHSIFRITLRLLGVRRMSVRRYFCCRLSMVIRSHPGASLGLTFSLISCATSFGLLCFILPSGPTQCFQSRIISPSFGWNVFSRYSWYLSAYCLLHFAQLPSEFLTGDCCTTVLTLLKLSTVKIQFYHDLIIHLERCSVAHFLIFESSFFIAELRYLVLFRRPGISIDAKILRKKIRFLPSEREVGVLFHAVCWIISTCASLSMNLLHCLIHFNFSMKLTHLCRFPVEVWSFQLAFCQCNQE